MCITLINSSLYSNENMDSLVSVNSSKTKFFKLTAKEKFERIKIPLVKKESKKVFWLLPAIAWNNYDKTQIGLLLGADLDSVFSIKAIPMYGTGSKNLTGVFNSTFYIAPKRKFATSISLNAKRFSYLLFPEDLTYNKIAPEISVLVYKNDKATIHANFKHISIWQEYLYNGRKTTYSFLNELSVKHQCKREYLQLKNSLSFKSGKQFGILQLENKTQYNYKKLKSNSLYAGFLLGGFLYNTKAGNNIEAPAPLLLLSGTSNFGIHWLQKDYGFNQYYFDRNAEDNFFRRQSNTSDGGFKSITSAGNANKFMFALNLKSDVGIPYKVKRFLNVQPYSNIAFSKNGNLKGAFYAEAGVSLLFLDEVIGFHFPFATTKNIQNNQATILGTQKGDWAKKISFSFDLMRLRDKLK
ncbi:MAG: hypothetical protein KDE33_21565 [Bacteroidetes bacterium]|nr:hypothetical protein [Bacteroidota bacterium]